MVLAAPRSHGALLGAMLGQHPEAFGLPELNLFASDTLEGLWSEVVDPRQAQIHGLLRAVAQLFAGEQTIAAIAMARRWITRRMHWPTSRVFDELRAKASPFRIVEKSLVNVMHEDNLERLGEACPDAYFVHVVRHPLAFGTAVLAHAEDARRFRREMTEADAPERAPDPQLLWLGIERRIARFLDGIPAARQVHLRIEALFADPEPQLRTLARALRLPAGHAALDAMLHPEQSPFAGMGPVGASFGDDLEFLQNPKFPVPLVSTTELDGPLPWRRDRAGFRSEVVERARALGYG